MVVWCTVQLKKLHSHAVLMQMNVRKLWQNLSTIQVDMLLLTRSVFSIFPDAWPHRWLRHVRGHACSDELTCLSVGESPTPEWVSKLSPWHLRWMVWSNQIGTDQSRLVGNDSRSQADAWLAFSRHMTFWGSPRWKKNHAYAATGINRGPFA